MDSAAQPETHTRRVPETSVSRRIGGRIREARRARGLSLAALGGDAISRGFLSAVETGRSGISLETLALIAGRLDLPISYFVDERPLITPGVNTPNVDHVRAALAYGRYLRSIGETEDALEYALWVAEHLAGDPPAPSRKETA